MEYSMSTDFLALTLISFAPAIIYFVVMDGLTYEKYDVRLVQNNVLPIFSMVGMAVIFFSFRSEIFHVANSYLI